MGWDTLFPFKKCAHGILFSSIALKTLSIQWDGTFLHLKSNPKEFKGPDKNLIDSLTKTKILELRDIVLSNIFPGLE